MWLWPAFRSTYRWGQWEPSMRTPSQLGGDMWWKKTSFASISKKKQLGQRGGKVMVPPELEMMIYTADDPHFEPKRFVVYRCFSFLTVVFSGSSRWFSGDVNLTCSILWGKFNACIPKHLLIPGLWKVWSPRFPLGTVSFGSMSPHSQTIHGTGIFTDTFTIQINQILGHIPYMDG